MVNTQLQKIITKAGDGGTTNLVYKDVHKSDVIIECIGSIDEANATIGHAREAMVTKQFDEILDEIQNNLFDLSADLICATNKINDEHITKIEVNANTINSTLDPITSFIIPKGRASAIHVARSVVRRAERAFWTFKSDQNYENPNPGIYLNRLSDLLFIIARVVHIWEDKEELWNRLK